MVTTNETVESHRTVVVGSERSFGIVFSILFAVIWLGPLYHGGAPRWWSLLVSAAFLLCAFAVPRLLRPINLLWFKFGLMLHHVVNPIVMGVLYFGAVVPMGIVLRAKGKDLLRLKFDKRVSTYWISRQPPAPPPGGMTKQF